MPAPAYSALRWCGDALLSLLRPMNSLLHTMAAGLADDTRTFLPGLTITDESDGSADVAANGFTYSGAPCIGEGIPGGSSVITVAVQRGRQIIGAGGYMAPE